MTNKKSSRISGGGGGERSAGSCFVWRKKIDRVVPERQKVAISVKAEKKKQSERMRRRCCGWGNQRWTKVKCSKLNHVWKSKKKSVKDGLLTPRVLIDEGDDRQVCCSESPNA